MSEKRSESTRKKILDATLILMRETGNIEDVSVRKIVEKAGIKGVGIINYHFHLISLRINEGKSCGLNYRNSTPLLGKQI